MRLSYTVSSESLEKPSSLELEIREGLSLTQLDTKKALSQLYFMSILEKLLQGMMGGFTDFNMFLLMAARKTS